MVSYPSMKSRKKRKGSCWNERTTKITTIETVLINVSSEEDYQFVSTGKYYELQ